ncbi:MAG: branched-chain amino acid ABC transporter permease [Deltaproteobacteria bacterium]|nr:branched-chain amino acid ABC transporter permease [Deltaproteobacteria bacterium]MBW2136380.1 branched-chain amino acid ABC transporter permease [Deltaproteobacteria bacterium]
MKNRIKSPLLLALAIGAIFLPLVVKSNYFLHLVIYVAMYSMLGMGFSMMWKNRLITCGQAGFFAVGAYTSALLVTKMGISFWLTLPISGVASALFAFILFSAALRGGPLVFFGMSLVSSFIVMEVLGTVEFFGGWEGILDIPSAFIGSYFFYSKISNYYLVVILLSLNIVVFNALYKSRIGRAWSAIGSSVPLAEAQGINVYRYRLAAATIACFFAGVAGAFYSQYQNLLVPNTFSFLLSIYVQMYALLGGLSFFIAGPIIGAGIMVFLPESLRVAEQFQPIFFAILVIMIVIFLPGGILSLPRRIPQLAGKLGRK